MKTFFAGLIAVLVALVLIPFVTGYILHSESFEFFLALISGMFMLLGFVFLVRGRILQSLLILAFSGIAFLSSKNMISFYGMDSFFYSQIYLGGAYLPTWLVGLGILLLIVMLAKSKS